MGFTFDWKKAQAELDAGGLGGAPPPAAPASEHGAGPIANRPECWAWRPKVPEWLRGVPEFEPAPTADAPEAPDRVDSYGTVPQAQVATAAVDKAQPGGPPQWMYGPGGAEAFLGPVLGPQAEG